MFTNCWPQLLPYSPRPIIHIMWFRALPQKSDYSVTFEANCVSAPKINLTERVISVTSASVVAFSPAEILVLAACTPNRLGGKIHTPQQRPIAWVRAEAVELRHDYDFPGEGEAFFH